MRNFIFAVIGIFIFIKNVSGLPNLATTIPSGWDAPLVVSITQDLTSEDTLYTNATYYYSWAVTNNGDQNVTNAFNIQIIRGDSVIKSYRPTSLNVGVVLKVTYLQDMVSTPGNYNMRLVVDSLSEVTESSESDNRYSHNCYWAPGAPPDIDVNPTSLYYQYHIPGTKYTACSWAPGEVIVDIDVPAFNIKELSKGTQSINIDGFELLKEPGKPALPFKLLTLAIPPGAVVQNVEVRGTLTTLTGNYNIEPATPVFPMNENPKLVSQCYDKYNANKQMIYSSNTPYPSSSGELVSTGGLRKYNLAMVAVYPVLYNPVKGELQYASRMQVVIHYTTDTDRQADYARLASDNLFDLEASELIDNWNQAQQWYSIKGGSKALYDYVIITSSALVPACSTIANWKTGLGYKVNIVTKEWIISNYTTGVDFQQNMRNFLRDKYPSGQWGIKWVLIVGDHYTIPMRSCCVTSNNPGTDSTMMPIPTDLYYAELTNPDNTSWNKDGDGYWGEALTSGGSPGGNDSPDYVADVYLGRIPWSDVSKIRHISYKIINFERNTDVSYKKKALLAAGILFFDNENNSGRSVIDGAEIMEDMLTASIINRSTTTTLYEKKGLAPSTYSCTDSITEDHIRNYWQGIGIYAEFNHGSEIAYVRKVWSTDDGDGVPEDAELTWPMAMYTGDAASLDDNKPAVGYLNSCLNGYPEYIGNLGATLLYQGCISVCSATRVSWTGSEDMMYYFFRRLLQDTSFSRGQIGTAFDLARRNYVSAHGVSSVQAWTNILAFNIYGDPSLHHLGYDSTACVGKTMWVCNRGGMPTSLSVSNITYSKPWIIEVSPTSMTVVPGESSGVAVTVQPAGLQAGYYYDTLRITSNDPDETTYKEPVTLRVVSGGIAEITPTGNLFLKLDAYPNPFSKKVYIKCSIPLNKVSLGIYDLSGRLVKSFNLDSGTKNPISSITWDASTCPAGIYFIRLTAGDLKTTGKLILMK